MGLALVAAVALTAVAAGPAAAITTPEGEFGIFNECALNNPAMSGCIYGVAGKESFFQAGKVTVHFTNPVKLRVGFIENEETGELKVQGARNGNSVSRTANAGPDLTEGVNPALLPEAEKARYEAYLAGGGSTKTTATIELASPASSIFLNEAHLLSEEGESFGFPVMIHLSNKFLGKTCYVGDTLEPIEVPFTTGTTAPEPPNTPIKGQLGKIVVIGGGQILQVGNHLKKTILANNEYAAPGVHGCGISGGADEAIDSGLGLPSPAGSNTTELIGELFQAGAEAVREHIKQ